jgi:predicted small secreted protein
MEWSSFLITYGIGVVVGVIVWELLYKILKKNGLIK